MHNFKSIKLLQSRLFWSAVYRLWYCPLFLYISNYRFIDYRLHKTINVSILNERVKIIKRAVGTDPRKNSWNLPAQSNIVFCLRVYLRSNKLGTRTLYSWKNAVLWIQIRTAFDRLDPGPDLGEQKWPSKKEKGKKLHVLKFRMFSFEGRRIFLLLGRHSWRPGHKCIACNFCPEIWFSFNL